MSNLKIFATIIDQSAINQIYQLSKMNIFNDVPIRIMPDCHSGKGCVIGFTAKINDFVIPSLIGVDIGCGMGTFDLGKVEIDFQKLDDVVRKNIPSGRNVHEGRIVRFDKIQELYCYRELKDTKRMERSIGTLGGGRR